MIFNELNKFGYRLPIIQEGEYIHGDNLLGDLPTNPSGQWDSYLPDNELQNRGYETYSCVSEATLHCTEILQRKEFADTTKYSVRFLATMSDTGRKQGNDNQTVAETLRKLGCVQEVDWPFDAASYEAFYTPPSDKIIKLAKAQFIDNAFGHSWVQNTSPDAMKNALMYSPLALGVFAWPAPDADGIYHRPAGAQDCHCVTVYGYEDGVAWHIFDSYSNTKKRLAWDYGFGVGKRFTLNRVVPTSPSPSGWINWTTFISYIRQLLGLEGPTFGAARSTEWGTVRREFEKYVPKLCPFCGSKVSQLHHSQDAFHANPARELDPTQLRWACQGLLTKGHHLEEGHDGDFKSLNFTFDDRIEAYQNKKYWNGTEWAVNEKPRIKYKLTEDELTQWNKKFDTEWAYPTP